jgi:uncharacterized protein YecA (UPF0149 family)
MKKITAVFYEYPAALHDIEAWEKLKEDSITDIKNLTENSTMYFLNPKPQDKGLFDEEILITMPIQNPDLTTVEALLSSNYYYKTLIFGKVTSEWLKTVNSFINKWEAIKQTYLIQI